MSRSETVTVDVLRARLGLQDPQDHALERRWKSASRFREGDASVQEVLARGIGRTTEMILQGLAHVANTGEAVTFVAFDRDAARVIEGQARGYARQLGVDPQRITAVAARDRKTLRGVPPGRLLADHVVTDGM